ncbi:MAG: hypothetical protein ABI581_08940 [Sediminibacterium sp.]
MKIAKEDLFFQVGDFAVCAEFQEIMDELRDAIASVQWHLPGKFVINPTRMGNGVKPIKQKFVDFLESRKWEPEKSMSLVRGMNPGPIDAIKRTNQGIFAVEWETGNISSSHRALNKIALGIIQKQIIGGILVLPQRSLAKYLTDRIGNYEEIMPYVPLFHNLKIEEGLMGIIVVDYDDTSKDALLIPKGQDGNAKKIAKSELLLDE